MSDFNSERKRRLVHPLSRIPRVGLGRDFRAHLAQKLENEACGLFGHGAILAASPAAVSGGPRPVGDCDVADDFCQAFDVPFRSSPPSAARPLRSARLGMSARDILAALSVAIVWGLTFIAIKVGVGETSPLMLAALRFFFAAVPLVFFLAPPKAPAWAVVALWALDRGRAVRPAVHRHPSGLSGRACFAGHPGAGLLHHPPRLGAPGRAAAPRPDHRRGQSRFAGIAVIGSERLAGASLGPFLLVILAAAFWGSGNVLAKSVGKVDMLAFTVWSSLAAPLPLLALSLAVEGDGRPGRARPSGLEAGRQRAGHFLCRDGVRLRAMGAAAGRIIRRRRSRPSRCSCRSSA